MKTLDLYPKQTIIGDLSSKYVDNISHFEIGSNKAAIQLNGYEFFKINGGFPRRSKIVDINGDINRLPGQYIKECHHIIHKPYDVKGGYEQLVDFKFIMMNDEITVRWEAFGTENFDVDPQPSFGVEVYKTWHGGVSYHG